LRAETVPAVAVVIGVVAIPKGTLFRSKLASGLAVCLGGTLVVLVSWLPYALSGHSSLYVRSVFTVPLAYAASELGFVDTLLAMIGYALPSWDPLAENGGARSDSRSYWANCIASDISK
jgi:hypothetical protein